MKVSNKWIGFCFEQVIPNKLNIVILNDLDTSVLCQKIICSNVQLKGMACELLAQPCELRRHQLVKRVYGQDMTLFALEEYLTNKVLAVIYVFSGTNDVIPKSLVNQIAVNFQMTSSNIDKLLKNKKLQEVIRLTAIGFSTAEIAKALYLTPRGVDYHIKNAKDFLGANNKSHLIYLAIKRGWIN